MERLWAPWRLSYVTGEDKSKSPGTVDIVGTDVGKTGCIFCDKPRENRDEDNLILQRGQTCYVILNAFPYNNGHLMIVPFRHLSHPGELTAEENAEIMTLASTMTRVLDRVYHPDGYNIGMNVGSAAGAGIASHLHLHVVPRWGGDTNFMPVIGDVKILPELLQQTFQKLQIAWNEEHPIAP